MIGAQGRFPVFAYRRPADLRRGFEGISALVREALGQDPLSGALYHRRRCRRRCSSTTWPGRRSSRVAIDLHGAQLEEAAAGPRKNGAGLESIGVRRQAGRRRCRPTSEGPTSWDAAGEGSPGLARRPIVRHTAGERYFEDDAQRSPRGRARATGYPAAARDPRPSAPRSSPTAPPAPRSPGAPLSRAGS